MPAVINKKPYRLDPCPAEERVSQTYDDLPDAYSNHERRGTEGYIYGDDGVIMQKCGGGRRIIKKKIGSN